MKIEPDADSRDRHMDLVSIISFIVGDRCSEYSLYGMCSSAQTSGRGKLFCRAMPTNFYRLPRPTGQCTESYPNSLWLLVRDIFNTLVRE